MKRIQMNTIMAGPEGAFEPGRKLTIGVDISAERAEELVKGQYAKVIGTGPAARETAALDPDAVAEIERAKAQEDAAEAAKREADREAAAKAPDAIKAALEKLNPTDDEDWTGGGKPAMDKLKELTGSKTLTRADVDAVDPEFQRPKPNDGGGEGGQGGGQGGGARTNKP